MKRRLLGLITILTITMSLSLAATTPKKAKDETRSSHEIETMSLVGQSFVQLIPYIMSEDKFLDSKNEKKINSLLNDLLYAFKFSKHINQFNKASFRPSFEVIQNHTKRAISIFNSKNKKFSLLRLRMTGAICLSCHTQMGQQTSKLNFGDQLNSLGKKYFKSAVSYAEYLFVLKDYKRFLSELDKYFKSERFDSQHEGPKALDLLVVYYSKIQYSPKKLLGLLKKNQSKFKDNRSAIKRITELKAELNSLTKQKWSIPQKKKEFESFLVKNIRPMEGKFLGENIVFSFMASGILSQYLNKFPGSKFQSEALYWLSIFERQMNRNYFFSLHDLYLKRCIQERPKSKMAKKCYDRYKDNIEIDFSGSAGIDIPVDIQKELVELRNQAY